MSDFLKILLIEDDDVDAMDAHRKLQKAFEGKLELDRCDNWQSGLDAILKNEHAVCLVDYRLGSDDGVELVRRAVAEGCTMPILLMTGMESETIDTLAMNAGAADYLVKDEMSTSLLKKAIRYAIARQEFQGSLIAAKNLLHAKNQKLSKLFETAHQFVDNVSHEFRTPLTVIKEYAAILQEGLAGEMNGEQTKFLGIISNRADDLTLMVNDMLDTSRLEAGLLVVRRGDYHLFEILDHIQPILARRAKGRGVTLEVDLDDHLPKIFCDSDKVARVVINLTVNAIKFTNEQGKVVICGRHDPAENQIVISVTDNGAGITPEKRQVIFKRFEQVGEDVRASKHGVGLGLAIARELVDLNLGQIFLESEKGRGSTFSFTVPEFDPEEIFIRWISRLERKFVEYQDILLIDVACDTPLKSNTLEDTAEFIQGVVHHDDLIIRTSTNRWLMLANASPHEITNLTERITQAHSGANQNRPDEELPKLSFELIGSWDLLDSQHELKNTFCKQIEKHVPLSYGRQKQDINLPAGTGSPTLQAKESSR